MSTYHVPALSQMFSTISVPFIILTRCMHFVYLHVIKKMRFPEVVTSLEITLLVAGCGGTCL
jgi:hypothetical protein